ncbi:LysR substrate-binding domain-containing protein [Bordetella genomosp. 13]|uniref:HTH lysR-type domain-containing protein n=1 Tax=Bordetella genomosp. 13 TaxID=463040 RepID=A0A1W6ZHW5_9BORD|nr:LysR substrate-binding domain-containing protein [Bordetella genomosp. 13]ARP96740.1 hypothetical protein CAL15_21655 [Bordetella genomosp. 13]
MTPSRPPFSLLSLQVFIAVARLGSFTRAADYLHLTQSAVSKHIGLLERHLGVPLLTRAGGVALTQAGIQFLDAIEPALEQIQYAVERVSAPAEQRAIVTFLAPPAVLQFWLVALLPRFAQEHPAIELQMRTRPVGGRVGRSDLDAEIRFGRGNWQGARDQYLFGREMCVIASPALCERLPLRDYADLRRVPRLQHVLYPTAWDEWRRTLAPGLEFDGQAQEYDHYSVMVEAVRAELGVAIMPRLLVRKMLASGELAAPFNEVMLGSGGYYLILRDHTAPAHAVRAAGAWIKARADEMAREWLAAARPPVVYTDSG